MEEATFVACTTCVAETVVRCAACVHNRKTIDRLRNERDALIGVYVAAARLRTFPVPFDDHFELVGAVDACRSILEPPIDVYAQCEDSVNADAFCGGSGRSEPLV